MERPHRVLEKKLHELEMQFNDLFFPPANSTSPCITANQERLSKEIKARVDFLKNLLSIEKAECQYLHGNAPTSHLVKLEERLEGLDTAFRDWMELEGGDDFLKKHVPGEFSVCSCPRSCSFSAKEDELDQEEEEEQVKEEEGSTGVAESDPTLTPRVELERFDEGKIDQKEPQGCKDLRRLSRIIVILVGAAVVVTVVISQVFRGFQDDVFLVPT